MPSDTAQAPAAEPPVTAYSALLAAAAPWRSAVVATVEEVRGMLGQPATPDAAAHSLGEFARGRIDHERFSGIVTRARPVETATLLRLRVAHDTLRALAERPLPELLSANVPPGGRIRGAVASVLAELGRAFGAAHEVALARRGDFREAEHGSMHASYPFERWTRRERRLAPPVLVQVDGADLDATDLLPFLDGTAKFLLVVRGACAPAPLVRLVTPGTYVVQSADPAAFAGLAEAPGPGVGALVPADAAQFVHDPSRGRAPWDRVRIDALPAEPPRRAVGPWSPEQQAEELRQLEALATRPSSVAMAVAAQSPNGATTEEPADPAGRLAAWLLEASAAPAAEARHG